MNRQTYCWSVALMLTSIAVTEVIYPLKTQEHFIATAPEYTPYMVAAICLCLALFAIFAFRNKPSHEFERLEDENEGVTSGSKDSSPKLTSSGTFIDHFSKFITGALQLRTPGGRVAFLSNDSSPSSSKAPSINGDNRVE